MGASKAVGRIVQRDPARLNRLRPAAEGVTVSVPAYRGRFGAKQAERLLWRAGFGPRKGEAAALAKLGFNGAVRSLTHPRGEKWVGPSPRDDKGRALAPAESTDAADRKLERPRPDVGNLVDELVGRASVDIAGKPQGDVHVLRLDPPGAGQRCTHQRQMRSYRARDLDRREQPRHG